MPLDLNAIVLLIDMRNRAREEVRVSKDHIDIARVRREVAQSTIDRIEATLAKIAPTVVYDTALDRTKTLDDLLAILDPPVHADGP